NGYRRNRVMRIRKLAIAFVLCLPVGIFAQQDDSPALPRAIAPEEVLVIGDRFRLRAQMNEAEQKAYAVFNRFNDEKRFMISCSMHEPTGTHLARQVCQAAFERDATAAHGRNYLEDYRAFIDRELFGPTWNPVPQVTQQPVASEIARQTR